MCVFINEAELEWLNDIQFSRLELIFLLSPTIQLRVKLIKLFADSFLEEKRCEVKPEQIFSILQFIFQLDKTGKNKIESVLKKNPLTKIWRKAMKNKLKSLYQTTENFVNDDLLININWREHRVELCLENVIFVLN